MGIDSVEGNSLDGSLCVERAIEADRTASAAVLEAVGELDGRPPEQLACLFDTLDPDALDALVDSAAPGTLGIQFQYADYQVDVTGDRVRVSEPDPRRAD